MNGKISLCLWPEKINCKMAILPKLIYRVDVIPTRIPPDFFIETEKLILKFIQNYNRSRIAKTIFEKKKVEELIHPDFKIHYKAMLINVVWYWHRTDL